MNEILKRIVAFVGLFAIRNDMSNAKDLRALTDNWHSRNRITRHVAFALLHTEHRIWFGIGMIAMKVLGRLL